MAELDQDQIIHTLLEKTRQGRVNWQQSAPSTSFKCSLEEKYFISISKYGDNFRLNMSDQEAVELLSIWVELEVVFPTSADELRYDRLRALYELARRKALNIDQKIAEASDLLEKI